MCARAAATMAREHACQGQEHKLLFLYLFNLMRNNIIE